MIQKSVEESVQEIKEKTFEDICPTYSKILANWDNLTIDQKIGVITDIRRSTAKCILGEAYKGFSGYPYVCEECRKYGSCEDGLPCAFFGTLPNDIYRPDYLVNVKMAGVNWREFEEIKSEFVEHWNKSHPNIMEEIEKYKKLPSAIVKGFL